MQDYLGTIKRIIFFVENRFTLRNYQRFGIELLRENGFHVEVWDLTSILHPTYSQVYTPVDLSNYHRLTLFDDKLKLYDELSNLSCSDFVINLITYNFSSLWIYRALSKSYANYAVSYVNAVPIPVIKKDRLDMLIEIFKKLSSIRHIEVWKRLFMKLPLWCLGVRPASLMFVAGSRYFTYRYYLRYPIDKSTELLQIHAFDYDLYLKEKDSSCNERPIAVFLDEFYPFHPDYDFLRQRSPASADSYYEFVNTFFDLVEEKTGLEVIIAAHPRSNYEELPDYFKGRKRIRGKTIHLIKDSKLVLVHSSTAFNLANLFYKPVIFMTWSDLDRAYEGSYIREYAKGFNKVPIFIDKENHNIDWEWELTVNREHYDNYRRAYIKIEDSEDLPFWQIVANRFRKGFYKNYGR